MSLRDYARKRRFDQTPEPAANAGRTPGHRPVFVVQLHDARSRHYDFRLEMDGVLKSWAVPKGPSLRVGEKRLAVEVEDHPLDYATFEGDIPAGNYGAGHVDVFDHGHWACDGDPLEALAAGKLDFTLSGGKLQGGWKLVRTNMRGKQRQWLLIKRDDAHAADREADDLVATPARSTKAGKRGTAGAKNAAVARKAAKKDAVWRKRALALEGARDGHMPVGFAPELTLLRATPPAGDDWLHEIKWDGYRLMTDIVDGVAKLRSRGGLDWDETFPDVAKAVAALPVADACLDGELVVLAEDGRSDFSELQRVIDGTSKAPLRYLVFDLPGLAGVDLRKAPLQARKALLKQLLGRSTGVLAFSDHVVGHGADVFAQTGQQRIEGVVSKRIDSSYRSGRSGDWIKAKHEESDEFIIVGYTAPKGSRSGFGSLLLATRERAGLRYVGRVGTGFDAAALRTIHQRLQAIERKTATVELPGHVSFPTRGVHWVAPKLVAEVAFRGWAKEGLLRQSSFKRLRADKRPRDVGPQVAGSKSQAGKTPMTRKPAKDNARITHPERVVFEGADYTKGDVADYYRGVARWLLPELVDRPLSLLRCPDGSQGECFFQKHHAGSLGDHVHAIALKQKSGSEQYLYVDSIEGVIDLVQMNTLEFHPWGARIDDPEQPDRLVFDLDPGEGVRWPAVVAAARDLRGKLEQAGLQSFVRLSGGKGLHVVVPIARGPSWDVVHGFCEAFSSAMAAHAPERYVATMSKAKRPGKIFIDWLRNTRGATSVASWSLRARRGAPVAVPLRWEELGSIKRPDAFDLAKAKQRAARLRKDPWAGFDGLRQALPDITE
ncbi:DNA ligase D [Luteimonas mephitis]|uniref:DNA ligase D n=1 Tax=Luteimonas mephitis TaxID=83615 RepID=UPI003A946929